MADKMQMLKQKISAANLTVDELAVQIGMNLAHFTGRQKVAWTHSLLVRCTTLWTP